VHRRRPPHLNSSPESFHQIGTFFRGAVRVG
jgi:hypothetical protein